MVVWSGLISVSPAGLLLAGVVPGVMIGLALMGTVYLYAIRRGYPVYERATLREFGATLGSAILALITPAIIVGGIVAGWFTSTEASVVAVVYAAALGLLVYRTMNRRAFARVLFDSARLASISLFCIGTAAAFGWLLAYFRVPQSIVGTLAAWGTGATATAFLIAAAFLIIGLFIDAVPAIMILGTILAPVADSAGIHAIHFAIIGVVSLAFGLVTPPYGLCLLICASIGRIKVIHALKDVSVILIPMLVILAIVILFPEVVLFLPRWIVPQFL
jgi:tripartite ATP-independent transporter DctM subunit